MIDGERVIGDEDEAEDGVGDVAANVDSAGWVVPDEVGVTLEALKPSAGGSTCWEVELKYRARYGRRNVGGSADGGILKSKMDLLIVLLNIVRAGNAIPHDNARLVILIYSFEV